MTAERIELDIDADLDAMLAPKAEEEEHHDFIMPEADMRLICRALRGDPPMDDAERESRRIVLNGLVYMLTDEQEVGAYGDE